MEQQKSLAESFENEKLDKARLNVCAVHLRKNGNYWQETWLRAVYISIPVSWTIETWYTKHSLVKFT